MRGRCEQVGGGRVCVGVGVGLGVGVGVGVGVTNCVSLSCRGKVSKASGTRHPNMHATASTCKHHAIRWATVFCSPWPLVEGKQRQGSHLPDDLTLHLIHDRINIQGD